MRSSYRNRGAAGILHWSRAQSPRTGAQCPRVIGSSPDRGQEASNPGSSDMQQSVSPKLGPWAQVPDPGLSPGTSALVPGARAAGGCKYAFHTVCVYIYIYIYTHIHTHTYICMYIYIYIYTYIHTQMYIASVFENSCC